MSPSGQIQNKWKQNPTCSKLNYVVKKILFKEKPDQRK